VAIRSTPPRVPRHQSAVVLLYFAGLAALMAALLLNVLQDVIPSGVAARIGFNSEGYIAALLLALWIQFVRPRLTDRPWQWPVTLAVGAAFAAIGLVLFDSDLPSRVKTLNESMFGLALVIPYVQLRRPLPRWVPWTLSSLVLAVIVVFNRTTDVTLLSEGLGMLVLVPLGLDVVDRAILDPERATSARLRYGWYALLVLMPIMSSLLYHGQVFGGLAGEVVRYEVRLHEAFICMLLVELYFAVGLGRTGRKAAAGRGPDRRADPDSVGRIVRSSVTREAR
jgi:hypothetical protein